MIRYPLDNLGWYQFEWLIQSLLKAHCGLAVESWGGSGDYGRDAFCPLPMKFPGHEQSEGPFLFQVKFVEDANSSGAQSGPKLRSAVQKEIKLINKRHAEGCWQHCSYYVLITNAPVSAQLRTKLVAILLAANIADNILILHSSDVCDLLDQHESIRRAFPQLLSFRELEALLQGQINKSVVARSQSTLDEAKNLLSVFVATTAYTRAFEILRNHHYVVLSGPPEMGKTAIALMIAMFQMTLNWQAILCNKPNDFFQLYDGASKQIFIADDAFGRTEYDTSRGQEWEQDLSRILNRVDSSHWLVWTSRRHILERAMAQIDLQGRARQFPQVAEVIVNADKLSLPEKALILYRHAKAVGLDSEAKEIIKQFAHDIVYNPYFTPERIRRLVEEVLPDLKEQLHNVTLVRTAIIDVLETPTDRVRKTFEKLSGNHKRLLLALLEAGHEANTSELKQLYEDFGAPTEPKMNFETVLDELTESFIRTY